MAFLEAGRGAAERGPVHFAELERTTVGALADADRPLRMRGQVAVWGNLGAGLYLLVAGAWLTPALSIPQAITATALGAALGSMIVAAAARLGAVENRPGVVLHRAALGESGAHLYAALACVRHLAFAALALALAAQAAGAVLSRYGLEGGQPLWAALFGVLVLLMVLAGPATMIRWWLVPSAGLTLLIAVVFTYSAWSDFGIPSLLRREPSGGWPSMTAGVDIVAALTLLWLPVASDLGRLSTARRAGLAAFSGLAATTAWFVLLGALFVPAVDGRDLAGFLLATPAGALALLLLVVLELDGVFVSLYALASTVRAWAPKADAALPAVLGGAGLIVAVGALLDPFAYGDALLLLGAAFVPLFGVLLGARAARRWAGYRPPPRFGGAVAWALGFVVYSWAAPVSVPAWTAGMLALFHDTLRLPFPLAAPGLSATVLAFATAFALGAATNALRSARPVGAAIGMTSGAGVQP